MGTLPAARVGRQDSHRRVFYLEKHVFWSRPWRRTADRLTGPGRTTLGTIPCPSTCDAKEIALSASDPNYDPASDTYRQIYQGHDNASAVTNPEGLTVYFDPDTNEVLGFTITPFSEYYKAHSTPDGEFEVNLPAKVPISIEEEMDFDAETIRSGVRIAEFY